MRQGISRFGFSFVELLIVISLLLVVIGVITATVTGGFNVWERMLAKGNRQASIQVAFSQLRQDMRNIRKFSPIKFEGQYDSFSFPSVLLTSLKGGGQATEMGRRGYYFKSSEDTLCLSQTPYRLMRRIGLKERCSPVLEGIERIKLYYGAFDSEVRSMEWVSSWSSEEPPMAIKLELSYRPKSNEPLTTETAVIFIPISSFYLKEKE